MSLEAEYIIHYDTLVGFVKRKFGSKLWLDAEDVVQELYFLVIKIKDKVNNPLNYLTTMVYRMTINIIHREQRKAELDFSGIEDTKNSVDEQYDVIVSAIEKLSKNRKLMMACIKEGMSLKEAQTLLKISWRNAKAYYYLAIKDIRNYVKAYC